VAEEDPEIRRQMRDAADFALKDEE